MGKRMAVNLARQLQDTNSVSRDALSPQRDASLRHQEDESAPLIPASTPRLQPIEARSRGVQVVCAEEGAE